MSMLNQVKNISDKDKDILKFVLQGKKILAIKHTRELYGYGLKEAKDYVEELERRWEDSI
jgi:ribosomal protein L7/L12